MQICKKAIFVFILFAVIIVCAIPSYKLTFLYGGNSYSLPVDSIDSICFNEEIGQLVMVHTKNGKILPMTFDEAQPSLWAGDTLKLFFEDDHVVVNNPRIDMVDVHVSDSASDIRIDMGKLADLVIMAAGKSDNGRISINADTSYTFIMSGLELASKSGPVFNSMSKQKVSIVLSDSTANFFTDASSYTFHDSLETANGCLSSQGAITFSGNGNLTVEGNMKHAIYSKKSITFKNGTFNVNSAISDAIHSGKGITIKGGSFNLYGMQGDGIDADDEFVMSAGNIKMEIVGDAAKGIKCNGIIEIKNGTIDAVANGKLENEDGELGYCSIIKCDSDLVISGGIHSLINNSEGGKCITARKNITITGGKLNLETHCDGQEYTNSDGEIDYYTSKCISADDSLFIRRGEICCISTGVGGKGIVAGRYMAIGNETDSVYSQGPSLEVITKGTCIIDNVDEDLRFGCPKGIKANERLDIYSGNIYVKTDGMGGEGVECNGEFYFHNGMLECECYDDGINVGNKLEIMGGYVYCSSSDNDGIDSNGEITISGGIVASINQSAPNESFDTEKRQLHITGGTIFGIGSSKVKIGDCSLPFYNTLYNNDPDKPIQRGLRLTNGKYVYIKKGGEILMALLNDNKERQTFVTVVRSDFDENMMYGIYEGDLPTESAETYFHNKLIIGGEPMNEEPILFFQPTRVIE